MKKLIIVLFLPLTMVYGQTQIGGDIDGEAGGDSSGTSVSLSSDGSIVAIGAIGNADGGTFIGQVRIYENIDGTWSQNGEDINGEAGLDSSGVSVSLSADGGIVAIGAAGNDGNGLDSGHVRIYENIDGSWVQVGEDIDGEALGDGLGISVSLSSDGSIVAIGADSNDDNGENAGHVRVYENIDGTWTQIGEDIDGEAAGDRSGRGVSLSDNGSIVAIGSLSNDDNGENAGHVRVYENINGIWTQVGSNIDGETQGDFFGWRVSLSGDGTVVAIGAISNDGNGEDSGHVRVYENIDGVWTQIGSDIDGEVAEDESGLGLSLSSDGTVIAIGAKGNDGNGESSGHVRIYQNVDGNWVQLGLDIDGEAAGDESGSSVSLSGDGSIVTIGAAGNDGNGFDSGHVRVYDLSEAVLSVTDISVEENLVVYPNPASKTITLELSENSILKKVIIYNDLGQLVQTKNDTFIDISELHSGTYYVNVVTSTGVTTKQLIIK